jgi:hypothetical protein
MKRRTLLLVGLLALPVQAEDGKEPAETVIAGDYFGAGDELQPGSAIEGDAFVAGRQVTLPVPVEGDAVLAGSEVAVRGRVGADLYAAAEFLIIEAPVARNARLAGRRIQIMPAADIAGRVTMAGQDVRVEGGVAGQLTIFGDSVTLDGRMGSGVLVYARSLTVGPHARIQGRLTYRTEDPPTISPEAEIVGGVKESTAEVPKPDVGPWARIAGWIATVALALGVFVVGVIAILGAPVASTWVGRTIGARPLSSFFTGLAAFILWPVVALVLMATIIGIPLGLLLLFAWPVWLLIGFLCGALFLSDSLAALVTRSEDGPSVGMRIGFLALVLLGVLLLTLVPFVGWVIGIILLLLGSGAILLALFTRGSDHLAARSDERRMPIPGL